MIKKRYEIETEGDEVINVAVTSAGDIRLDCGSVDLTMDEAAELAHCLLDLSKGDSTTTIQHHEVAPPLLKPKAKQSLLEYGDGGKLNPQ